MSEYLRWAFLQKILTAKSCQLFFQESCTIDIGYVLNTALGNTVKERAI